MKRTHRRQILSLLLCLCLALALLPASAQVQSGGGGQILVEDNCDNLAAAGYGAGTEYPSHAQAVSIFEIAQTTDGAYHFSTTDYQTEAARGIRKAITYDGGTFEAVLDVKLDELPVISTNLGWRGFTFELRTPSDTRRFTLTADSSGAVLCNILRGPANGTGTYESASTGLHLGDRAEIKLAVDENAVPRLYVNSSLVHTFQAFNYTANTVGGTYLEISASTLNRDTSKPNRGGGVNVKLYSYQVSRPGTGTGNTALISQDLNPYTGRAGSFQQQGTVALDTNYNSLVLDQGSARSFNQVILKDSDSSSRVSKKDLSLYVSSDNQTYQRIKDWDFLQLGNTYYLYNFSSSARYVKVHCHYDSFDQVESFTNNLQSILAVKQESPTLIGANGGSFSKTSTVTVRNTGSETLYDYAAYLSTAQLKLVSGYYQADLSDLRISLDGKLLHHYYDKTGVFVRIPQLGAGSSVNLTVSYGNASAQSVSSGRETFEVEYGNKTLQDMTVNGTFEDNMVVRSMPNGDLIAIGNKVAKTCAIYQKTSTDGGRTWGQPRQIISSANGKRNEGGGFLEDGNRVYFIYYEYANFNASNMNASDCKIALIHTDDSGRTWSQPQVITQPGRNYTLTYTDGIVTSVADGNGPNVDYVITYGMQNNNDGGFAVSGLYSTDAGRTWTPSSSIVELDATAFEGGVSETAIVELKDHRLYMLMRCQFASVVNFYQSYSNDYGKTWQSPPTPSVINAPNTMPVLERYQEKLLLLWAGNNTLGGSSYRRTPVTLAYSDNEALSWKQNLDVTYGTSWSSYDDSFNRATQPDITFPGYQNSKDAYLGWWNYQKHQNWGVLIEDFDDYLFKTQGAYDSFEGPNLKNEGWLSVVGGTVTLSGDRATDGSKSMLLTDGASSIVRATRNLPSMTKGSISYDAYFPSGNNATFYTELKSSYNTAHRDHAPIVFCVTPDGDVHKDPGSEVVGHITLDQWHNFQVNFNLESMTAQLLVDGTVMCSNLPVVEGRGSFISCVQLSDASSFNAAGSKLYVDQFRATISNKTAGTVTVVG